MTILVVMGVSGSGKTTIAAGVALHLGWRLVEGDDFHPQANVAKMQAGTPLTDEDRWPWLHAIAAEMLSDFHREASRAYGVLIAERFYANRAYFLIDREGVVRWSYVERTLGSRRENAELLAAIEQLG